MTKLAAGQPAPAFQAVAHDGSTVALHDFHGRWVLLWFYPEADTPGCTAEACGLRDEFRALTALGLVVLGVSFDDVAKNAAFAEKFHLPYRLLCDTDQELGRAYDAIETEGEDAGWPHRVSFLIDPRGQLVRVYDPVDPKTHAATVLHDLEIAQD
ncbi:MAG TPA: peroxiredoxin [Kofleriaceae bacterium]|nr:peroxiredoxin [Kofleriaceae bacterium]